MSMRSQEIRNGIVIGIAIASETNLVVSTKDIDLETQEIDMLEEGQMANQILT